MLSVLTVHNACECVIQKTKQVGENTERKPVELHCDVLRHTQCQFTDIIQKAIVFKSEVSSNRRSEEATLDEMASDKRHQTKRSQTKQYLAKWYQTNRAEINDIRTDGLNPVNVPALALQVKIHSHLQE